MKILTSRQYEECAYDIFPQEFIGAIAKPLGHIIVPSDIDGHIARQSVGYENSKCKHSFDQLSGTEMNQ